MPRKLRRTRLRAGLTPDQRAHLEFGPGLSKAAPFTSDTEEATAWSKYRTMLMTEYRTGRRPAAYYRHDLRMAAPPANSFEEVEALRSRGLLDQEEIRAIEVQFFLLDAANAAVAYSSYDRPEMIEQLDSSGRTARKFEIAAHWHSWRGRPELAELYRKRADAVRRAEAAADWRV